MAKAKIGIIVGSTRIGRFAETPAKWIAGLADKRDDIEDPESSGRQCQHGKT